MFGDGEVRRGIEAVTFFCVIGLLALFGASAKILTRWETEARSVARVVGSCMISVFVACVVGLVLIEIMADRPMLLLGIAAAAGYLGVEIADSVMRRVLGLGKITVDLPSKGDVP